jgi:hypothetical protein
MHDASTVAAYRDRWHITGEGGIGRASDAVSSEQTIQRRLAEGAAKRAVAISHGARGEQSRIDSEPQIDVVRGAEL